MRLLIPVAGRGTRLRPHTLLHPKPLLNVAGKPIIAHILDGLPMEDVEDIVLVINPDGGAIEKFVTEYSGKETHAVIQHKPLGLGHAIYTAREWLKGEVLIILGDTIVEADIKVHIENKRDFLGVKEVKDPRRFGVAILDREGKIYELEEKPEHPKSNCALVGLYYINEAEKLEKALSYIIENNIKTRGEYQLTDALSRLLKIDKWRPDPLFITGWYDCGKVDALLETNRILLSKNVKPYAFPTALIIPPVHIGKNVDIEYAIIGPYVTINDNATIKNAILKDTIVNEGAYIRDFILDGSLIGKNAVIRGMARKLNIADYSELVMEGGKSEEG